MGVAESMAMCAATMHYTQCACSLIKNGPMGRLADARSIAVISDWLQPLLLRQLNRYHRRCAVLAQGT